MDRQRLKRQKALDSSTLRAAAVSTSAEIEDSEAENLVSIGRTRLSDGGGNVVADRGETVVECKNGVCTLNWKPKRQAA